MVVTTIFFFPSRLLLLPVPLPLRMANNLSSLFFPFLLTVGCVALVMNILSAKKVNKSLLENVETAQADLRVAMDTNNDCNKQLEMKDGDLAAKDQELASIADNVNLLTGEKKNIEDQMNQLQTELNQANADKDALTEEKNNLLNELESVKAAKSVEAPNEEAQKEEADTFIFLFMSYASITMFI